MSTPALSSFRGLSPAKADNHFDLLFFGDIVGKPGREAVYHFIENRLATKPDMMIANVENCTHGNGFCEKHYQELAARGFHAFTGGNHIYDRKDSLQFMRDSAEMLIRPANISGKKPPGLGARVIQVGNRKVGVLNVLGQAFMANYNSPWDAIDELLPDLLRETPIIFVDIHAEATAEKAAIARYVAEMGASAVVGTHTHVQTNDARLLHDRTGFLTDAGMNGVYESVIGMDSIAAIKRLTEPGHTKMEVAVSHTVQINAVRFRIEVDSGECIGLENVYDVFELPESVKVD